MGITFQHMSPCGIYSKHIKKYGNVLQGPFAGLVKKASLASLNMGCSTIVGQITSGRTRQEDDHHGVLEKEVEKATCTILGN